MTMEPRILRWDATRTYDTDERCSINELSNHSDDGDVSIARARVAPGVTTRWHRLRGIAERYVMLEGRGTVEVDGLGPSSVVPGDVVLIPPGARQRIRNDGAADLVFLAVCTPRYVHDAYEDAEDTSL